MKHQVLLSSKDKSKKLKFNMKFDFFFLAYVSRLPVNL